MLTIAAVLSACGSSTTVDSNLNSSGFGGSGGASGQFSGNWMNLPLAPNFTDTIYGSASAQHGGFNPSAQFRVKITPQPAVSLPQAPGWTFPYGCVSVTVRVNNVTQTTAVLRVAGVTQNPNSQCANAPTSQILDFSNAMTGANSVSVRVSNPQYDNCRTNQPHQYGCSMSAVWTGHVVRIRTDVQPDGYWLDP